MVAKSALVSTTAAINVDFNSTTPQGASPNYSYAPAGTYAGTAVAPDQGTYWNALGIGAESTGPNTYTSGNLIAADSTLTNVSVSLGGFGVSDVQGKLNAGAGVAQALLNDFAFSSSGSATFSISGLASGVNYDIYLFSGGGTTGNSTTFTIGSQSLTVGGGNAATFDDATVDGIGNYVVFRAIVPTSSSISGTFSGSQSRLSGLQIIRVSAPGANAFNVDFDSTTTQSTTPAYPNAPSGTYSGTAPAPNAGGTWNGVGIGPQSPYVATFTSGFLNSSDGASANVSVTLTAFGVDDVKGQSNAGAGVAQALLNDFATVGASATTPTFSINGLTNNAYYDLYLYSGGGTLGNSTTFTVAGVSHAVSGGPFTGFDDATVDGTGNYVVFRNLVVSGGAITGTFTGSNSRFSGFQLVRGTPPATQFTYTLPAAATTSAGVYSNGALVRTLWFNVAKQAGTNTASWDNRDDQGFPVEPGPYELRVLYHNMQYVWDGMVGNSSATQSGTSVMAAMEPMQDLAITGTTAFYPTAYNEGHYDFHRFDTGNPRVLTDSWTWGARSDASYALYKMQDLYGPLWSFATTDGTNVYFASSEGWTSNTNLTPTAGYIVAANATTDAQSSAFTNGGYLPVPDGQNIWYHPKGIRVGTQPGLSGLSVEQSTGPLLAVAVAPDNKVYLRDKLSGDALADFAVTAPKRLAFDGGSRLWIAAGSNVYAYDVSNTSPYTATLAVTISGFTKALAVAPDATSSFVIVADGGSSMQLKGYDCGASSCTAASGWPYGQAGGYQTNGPAVTDDKLWFSGGYHKGEDTFVTIASDGTFWVGDGMNARVLHMSRTPAPHVIEKISMQPGGYNIAINQTNPRRVFRNFLEFEVDYGKNLNADGAWKLVNNWASVPSGAGYIDSTSASGGFIGVATLSNNRTYAQILRSQTDGSGALTFNDYELVELTSTGLRGTGQRAAGSILTNGELLRVEPNGSNGSFEVADAGSVYGGWQAFGWGASALTTTVKNAPETATEGSQYLNMRATSNTNGQTGFTLYHALGGQALERSHTFTVSFDLQDKSSGFDQAFVNLQAASSIAPTTIGGAAFWPTQDGAWHSYSATITVPTSTTQDSVELRLSFITNGSASGVTYEANLDNIRVTQGDHVLVDRGTQYWYRNTVTGFDSSGNPEWSPDTAIAALYEPRAGALGPVSGYTAAMTSTGVLLSYDSSFRDIKHLGGVATNGTSWAWRAFPTTKSTYQTWSYPVGYFDIGNGAVANAPDRVMSAGRNVVVGYHGEGWNGKQASQFMHFYDDGLFVGQFGQAYSLPNGTYLTPDDYAAGFAGNALSPVLTTYNGETYLYTNDEWGAALQRYHLVGANAIREAKGTGIAGSTIALVDAPYCPPPGQ